MSAMASQITRLTIVYSTVYPGADQSKNQSSMSLAFVRGIHQWPVNSPHKGPVTRNLFPFDDVIMSILYFHLLHILRYVTDVHTSTYLPPVSCFTHTIYTKTTLTPQYYFKLWFQLISVSSTPDFIHESCLFVVSSGHISSYKWQLVEGCEICESVLIREGNL